MSPRLLLITRQGAKDLKLLSFGDDEPDESAIEIEGHLT
jgi:hypothetical protein